MKADRRFAVANALSARRSAADDPQSAAAEHDVAESLLANLVDEITQRLNAGESIDIDEYVARYPEIADTLACVLATLMLVRQSPTADAIDAPQADGSAVGPSVGLLGDFRILREIGRGGMGVVYEAEQISLGRRVALKVLPFAAMLDKQQLARFKNEARAAATLDHPNIVAIYSVGVERSVHFYAMQLIEGQSLAQVVEHLRQSHLPRPLGEGRGEGHCGSDEQVGAASRAALPDNTDPSDSSPARLAGPTVDTAPIAALSTLPDFSSKEYFRTIAQLGIQAAEALDHAHQNGILHRDIKPANLLVECSHHAPRDEASNDPQGRKNHHVEDRPWRSERDAYTLKLWITDFGLARMEDDAGMTMTGDILGTLRYMSPEQALAKRVVVDHRSDIYSLGVTLYELLTLQPAFAGDDRQEILRQIAFEEPRKLRQINARISLDLETIVLKAVEKNPEDRYQSAQQFVDDLRHFLELKPIKARRPSVVERMQKWSRRHTSIVWFALIVMAVTVAALIVTSASITIALQSVETERERTADALAQSEAVVDFLVDDLLGSAVPSLIGGRHVLVADVLANAENRVGSAFPMQPMIAVRIREAMAKTYHKLSDLQAAERHLLKAISLLEEHGQGNHPTALRVRQELGVIYDAQGKLGEATRSIKHALEKQRRILGNNHRDTQVSVKSLAAVLSMRGRHDQAHELYKEYITVARQSGSKNREDLVSALTHLAILELRKCLAAQEPRVRELHANSAFNTAKQSYQLAIETLDPDNPTRLGAANTFAEFEAGRGNLDSAIAIATDTVERQRRLLGNQHPGTLDSMYELGHFYWLKEDLANAKRVLEENLQICQSVYGPNHRTTVSAQNGLARVLNDLGEVEEAKRLYRASIDSDLDPSVSNYKLDSLSRLANILDAEDQLPAAKELRDQEERLERETDSD